MFLFLLFSTLSPTSLLFFFFFNDTAPPEISPLPLHDALPICSAGSRPWAPPPCCAPRPHWPRHAPARPAGCAASRQACSTASPPRSRTTSPRAATPQIGRAHV